MLCIESPQDFRLASIYFDKRVQAERIAEKDDEAELASGFHHRRHCGRNSARG
jgi:hypothetical protein